MTYKLQNDLIGYLQPGQVSQTQDFPQAGTLQPAQDKVFGGGELMYARATGVIPVWQTCIFTPTWNATTLRYDIVPTPVPNTTNQSRAVGIAMQAMVAGDYGWFLVSGTCPASSTASVAASVPVGVAAAGQLGAAAAGKNVFGAVSIAPATVTVVVALTGGRIGNNQVNVANTNGLFVGGYVAGTGIGAANRIIAMDEDLNILTLAVVNTANVSGNLTQTANNAVIFYNTVSVNRPSLTNITV